MCPPPATVPATAQGRRSLRDSADQSGLLAAARPAVADEPGIAETRAGLLADGGYRVIAACPDAAILRGLFRLVEVLDAVQRHPVP